MNSSRNLYLRIQLFLLSILPFYINVQRYQNGIFIRRKVKLEQIIQILSNVNSELQQELCDVDLKTYTYLLKKMLPFLKQKKKRTGKKTKQKGFFKYCITLRQCAILFSILIFIFTAIFTTCAILGYLHAKNTIDILRDEIRIEREKSERDYSQNNFRISTNEILLIHSQSSLKTNESILRTFMHLGWLLMVMSGFLIYGTTTKSPRFMIPWILTSAVVYLCVIMGEILIYLDYIEGLNLNTNVVLIITMVVSTVFISMWYTMVLYHSTMKCRGCSQIISSKPKIIQAYGGYVHTINPNSLIKSKKPLV